MAGGFFQVSIIASSGTEEALCGFLFDEGALGLITEDIPGDPPGVLIRASFEETVPVGTLVNGLRQLQHSLASLGISSAADRIEVREIPLEDWGRDWKKHFTPLPVGRRLIIAPPWEAGPFPEDRLVLRIDPAMAFGTGHHATTRMCLERLEEFMERWPDGRGPMVLDVGTGTAILAIAAARLGAQRVVAIDTDPGACDAAKGNLPLNEGSERIQVIYGGVEVLRAGERFDLAMANLDLKALCPLFPPLAARLSSGGRLIVGGILVENEGALTAAARASGLGTVERQTDEEWRCLTLALLPDRPRLPLGDRHALP